MKLVAAIKRHPRRSLLVASSMLALAGFALYSFAPQYLSRFESAVVWCARFHVGFAVAPLDPVA